MSEAISGVWRSLTGFLWELNQCSYITPSMSQPPPVRPPADTPYETVVNGSKSAVTAPTGVGGSAIRVASDDTTLGYVSGADVRAGDVITITYYTSAAALPASGEVAVFVSGDDLLGGIVRGVVASVPGAHSYQVTVPDGATRLLVNSSAYADRQWGQLNIHIDTYHDAPSVTHVLATMDARRIAPSVVYASVTGIADPSLGSAGTTVYTVDLTIPLPMMPDSEQLPEDDPTEVTPDVLFTMGQPMVWEYTQCLLAAIEPVIGRQPWQVDYYIIQSMGPDPVPVITTSIAIMAEGV